MFIIILEVLQLSAIPFYVIILRNAIIIICGVFNKFPDFFVQAFRIVIDS